MNKDFLCALPDELILNILYFMDPISVGQCRSVNKRLSRLSYDKVLLRKFPHYVLKEDVYFKEEAYLSEGNFLELNPRDPSNRLYHAYSCRVFLMMPFEGIITIFLEWILIPYGN